MKTALFLALGLVSFSQALEVHEWGTFTVLSGSNGIQIPWYASNSDLAHLPAFVSPGIGGKTGMATIRMETPVLYFYPEKEMEVSVEVSFKNGTVSETFPHSYGGTVSFDPANIGSVAGKWTGKLHPPTNKGALAEIPAINESKNPEPYGAAREVPDAWIFESVLKEIPGLEVQPHFPQVEKFIFYRGACSDSLPVIAKTKGNEVSLENYDQSPVPFSTALRVKDGKAEWLALPKVPGYSPASKDNLILRNFTGAMRPLDEVESELATVWKNALAKQGLTPDEASAMVETWRKTWFRESGDRILSVMPSEKIDTMLPLKITPTPEKTIRVFVARFEMVSPEKEQQLVELLASTDPTPEDLRALDLGRFGYGAAAIASDLKKYEMLNRFSELNHKPNLSETSQR